ncbi:MAG: hypothetical protein EXR98_10265 [Gemmataceae bacterium]|nr:hypothetical protein [Gemmataceae bacterium]
MDAGSVKIVQQLIAMGSGSLLQYVSESSPYSADPAQAAIQRLLAIAHEERDEVARLTRLMQKMRERPPKIGSYPSHFTTMNFVTLDYLVPKLITEHEKEVAQISVALSQLDDEDAQKTVQTYLDMKRRHLEVLKDLVSSKPPAAAA